VKPPRRADGPAGSASSTSSVLTNCPCHHARDTRVLPCPRSRAKRPRWPLPTSS